MNKYFSVSALLFLMLALHLDVHAQPNPPSPPGSTTSVPLDPASAILLAGAAAIKWMKDRSTTAPED